MYASLAKWCTIPIQLLPYVSINTYGDKTLGPAQNLKCYAESRFLKLIDVKGIEVAPHVGNYVSHTILYIDGSVAITINDEVILNGTQYPIHGIQPVYDGTTGSNSIWMVYL